MHEWIAVTDAIGKCSQLSNPMHIYFSTFLPYSRGWYGNGFDLIVPCNFCLALKLRFYEIYFVSLCYRFFLNNAQHYPFAFLLSSSWREGSVKGNIWWVAAYFWTARSPITSQMDTISTFLHTSFCICLWVAN